MPVVVPQPPTVLQAVLVVGRVVVPGPTLEVQARQGKGSRAGRELLMVTPVVVVAHLPWVATVCLSRIPVSVVQANRRASRVQQ